MCQLLLPHWLILAGCSGEKLLRKRHCESHRSELQIKPTRSLPLALFCLAMIGLSQL
jgi:hypothetical protein